MDNKNLVSPALSGIKKNLTLNYYNSDSLQTLTLGKA